MVGIEANPRKKYQILYRNAPFLGAFLTARRTRRSGLSLSRLPYVNFVSGCFALTLSSWPDIFSTMKPILFALLFSGLLACTARNGSELSERQLAQVVLEVIRLHHRYAEHPDSLAIKRKAVLRGFQFTEKDLERLIATWKANPEALEIAYGRIMETLEADSVFVRWKKTAKRNTVGKRHPHKKKRRRVPQR